MIKEDAIFYCDYDVMDFERFLFYVDANDYQLSPTPFIVALHIVFEHLLFADTCSLNFYFGWQQTIKSNVLK